MLLKRFPLDTVIQHILEVYGLKIQLQRYWKQWQMTKGTNSTNYIRIKSYYWFENGTKHFSNKNYYHDVIQLQILFWPLSSINPVSVPAATFSYHPFQIFASSLFFHATSLIKIQFFWYYCLLLLEQNLLSICSVLQINILFFQFLECSFIPLFPRLKLRRRRFVIQANRLAFAFWHLSVIFGGMNSHIIWGMVRSGSL